MRKNITLDEMRDRAGRALYGEDLITVSDTDWAFYRIHGPTRTQRRRANGTIIEHIDRCPRKFRARLDSVLGRVARAVIARRRLLKGIAAAAIISKPAAAYYSAQVIPSPDPYVMTELAGNLGYLDISAKTLSSQTLNGSLKNGILLIAGQSNVCNNTPSAYTITNTGKVDCLNPYNGAIYAQTDPMLGNSAPGTFGSGNFGGRLADKLITAGKFDRVILCSVGVNGTAAADWQNTYGNRLLTALARLAYRGMTPSAILWGQGEEDNALATSSAAYQASMNALITLTRNWGYAGPWFIAEETWRAGATSATIQGAQAALVNHGSGIWAGPNADSLDATNRQADNTHLNDTGADAYAGLWQTALGLHGAPF